MRGLGREEINERARGTMGMGKARSQEALSIVLARKLFIFIYKKRECKTKVKTTLSVLLLARNSCLAAIA